MQAAQTAFEKELQSELAQLTQQGLQRHLREIQSCQNVRLKVQGRWVKNFSSNDYLGLAFHPTVIEAALTTTQTLGTGCGASRLICGSNYLLHELESNLALFIGKPACLVFSSGYSANLGILPAIARKGDFIVADKLAHASILDGARLSGATLLRYRHNNLAHLDSILSRITRAQICPKESKTVQGRVGSELSLSRPEGSSSPRIIIATESAFSMDGDVAPLNEIIELKKRYHAILYLDEAHAIGVLGPSGRGLSAATALIKDVEILVGTLGKSIGSAGGFVCGPQILIDWLIQQARSFVFSTAPAPAVPAAAIAALRIMNSEAGPDLIKKLWENIRIFSSRAGLHQLPSTAIIPILVGDADRAVSISKTLWDKGFFVPAIRYPTVPRNQSRLRITLSAGHDPADILELVSILHDLKMLPGTGNMS